MYVDKVHKPGRKAVDAAGWLASFGLGSGGMILLCDSKRRRKEKELDFRIVVVGQERGLAKGGYQILSSKSVSG